MFKWLSKIFRRVFVKKGPEIKPGFSDSDVDKLLVKKEPEFKFFVKKGPEIKPGFSDFDVQKFLKPGSSDFDIEKLFQAISKIQQNGEVDPHMKNLLRDFNLRSEEQGGGASSPISS